MQRLIHAGLCVALVGLAGLGLSQEKARTDSTPQAKAAPSATVARDGKAEKRGPYTVIGYLEKRDRVITIKSSPHGPVYSVATKDGKVLFENLSAEQLKAQALEIHELIKTGVAGDARVRTSAIDASVRVSAGR